MDSPQLTAVLRHIRSLAANPQMREQTDGALLRAFLTGNDQAAFEALVRRHGPMVLRVCRRALGNLHEAEDALQATFLVLARRAKSIRKKESLASWLHGVAHRMAKNAQRAAARRRGHEAKVNPTQPPDPALCAAWQELHALLDEEIEGLPKTVREPFVLCCVENQSCAEAARHLGVQEGTIWNRLGRARKLLQKRLIRRGITLPAGILAILLGQEVASAVVPAALIFSTAEAATRIAAGQTAAAVVTAETAALIEGMLRAIGVTRLKSLLVALLAVAIGFAGTGLVAYQVLAQKLSETTPKLSGQQPSAESNNREPGKQEQAAVDRYGDPLPPGALFRLGTVRFRLETAPDAAAVSPDGKIIAASAGGYGRVLLWDATTGKELRALDLPGGVRAGPVAFSPDGKVLATGSDDNIVRLWDPARGKELLQLVGHQRIHNNMLPEFGILNVLFAPDGKILASLGADRTVRLWQVGGAHQVRQFEVPTQLDIFEVRLVFAPDGKSLIVSGGKADKGGLIVVWDPATGKELRRWETASGIVALAVSPDGRSLAMGTSDEKVILWDMAEGRELRQLSPSHKGRAGALAFSDDGTMLASGSRYSDYSLRIWDVGSGKELRRIPTAIHNPGAAFLDRDRALLSWGGSGAVHFWDVRTGKAIRRFAGHEGQLAGVTCSPDGKTVATAGGNDGQVGLWDAGNGKQLAFLHEGGPVDANVTGVSFSPDGKVLASAHHNGIIRLWDFGTRKVLRQLNVAPDCLHAAYSSDGKLLATSSYPTTIQVWDVSSGKEIRKLSWGGNRAISGLAFSPAGYTLAASAMFGEEDGTPIFRAWDALTGKELLLRKQDRRGPNIRKPNEPEKLAGVTAVAFSPDGRTLITAEFDDTIRLWELSTGLERLRIKHPFHVTRIAISPDGRILASANSGAAVRGPQDPANGGGKLVLLWDMFTGKEIRRFRGHHSLVNSLAFSPDGILASASYDTTALLWDVKGVLKAQQQPIDANLEALWTDLCGTDAARAYHAMATMVAAPTESIRFLQAKIRPAEAADAKRVVQLIGDLNSERFAAREKADRELEKLGRSAEPWLRRALEGQPTAEVRRRVELLVEKLKDSPPWESRAIEVLEHISSPQAGRFLGTLAEGEQEAPVTQEAKAAPKRLQRR